MEFWIFMLIMVLLIPLVMIIFGVVFIKRSPKEINYLFGYRTAMSMKNMDTWSYAHRLIGKLWLILGLVSLPILLTPMFFVINKGEGTIAILGTILVFVGLILLVLTIIPVEIGLKKKFDENGNIREPKA